MKVINVKIDSQLKATLSDVKLTEHSELKYLNTDDDDRYLLRGVLLLTDYMHNKYKYNQL